MYTLLVTFFLLALIFSFLCSMWEAVLLSTTPTYARMQYQEGTVVGRYLEDFKANIDRPLSAILTLNTIAHTVGAIGVGQQAAVIWANANPWITNLGVPALMTIAILVLSEIVPKTIGALHWQRLVTFTVHSLRFLIVALAPLVWMSQYITRQLKHGSNQQVLTRTDFLAMAEIGAQEGVFEEEESQMIGNMIRFQTVQARDVMTPRTVVAAAAEDDTIASFHTPGKRQRFSRIPIFNASKDHITGYVLKADVLTALVEGRGDELLASLRREIIAVGETYPIVDLFSTLRERQEHIAVVLDDFGGMAGIVTMEDVIETLLGFEIVDETDTTTDMRILAERHRDRRAKTLGALDGPSLEN
ncbi:MAG: CNNM domain-containing protein [bacterium]